MAAVARWARYEYLLAAIFALAWVFAAAHPVSRGDWALENLLVIVLTPVVILLGRYFRLSRFSFTLITIFAVLHLAGSHWGYDNVPFGRVLQSLIGTPRNEYDRLVHFSFGLLAAYPLREVFVRLTGARGFWSYYFPFDIVMAFSALFEIFEWITTVTVNGPIAVSFLGAQGDIWDTQKDMACAAVGALIAMVLTFIFNARCNGGFMRELRESLRVSS